MQAIINVPSCHWFKRPYMISDAKGSSVLARIAGRRWREALLRASYGFRLRRNERLLRSVPGLESGTLGILNRWLAMAMML
jgi:hypothetical protein